MALGVDSVSNRNEYQEYFLGGEGGRWVRLTTLPTSYESIKLLEPSGLVQACTRTALPLKKKITEFYIYTFRSYRAVNTFRLGYESLYYKRNLCSEIHTIHKRSLRREQRTLNEKPGGT